MQFYQLSINRSSNTADTVSLSKMSSWMMKVCLGVTWGKLITRVRLGHNTRNTGICLHWSIHRYENSIVGRIRAEQQQLLHVPPPTTNEPQSMTPPQITTTMLVSLTHIINTASLLLLIWVRCIHSCWDQTVASCLESRTQKRTLDQPHLALLSRIQHVSSTRSRKRRRSKVVLEKIDLLHVSGFISWLYDLLLKYYYSEWYLIQIMYILWFSYLHQDLKLRVIRICSWNVICATLK